MVKNKLQPHLTFVAEGDEEEIATREFYSTNADGMVVHRSNGHDLRLRISNYAQQVFVPLLSRMHCFKYAAVCAYQRNGVIIAGDLLLDRHTHLFIPDDLSGLAATLLRRQPSGGDGRLVTHSDSYAENLFPFRDEHGSPHFLILRYDNPCRVWDISCVPAGRATMPPASRLFLPEQHR